MLAAIVCATAVSGISCSTIAFALSA